jgi:hypothetical protein
VYRSTIPPRAKRAIPLYGSVALCSFFSFPLPTSSTTSSLLPTASLQLPPAPTLPGEQPQLLRLKPDHLRRPSPRTAQSRYRHRRTTALLQLLKMRQNQLQVQIPLPLPPPFPPQPVIPHPAFPSAQQLSLPPVHPPPLAPSGGVPISTCMDFSGSATQSRSPTARIARMARSRSPPIV